jgi:hypothetical protein
MEFDMWGLVEALNGEMSDQNMKGVDSEDSEFDWLVDATIEAEGRVKALRDIFECDLGIISPCKYGSRSSILEFLEN